MLVPVQAGVTLWREKNTVWEKKERMREEEICVGHKGIKGQLNNSGHIFQAGGGILWATNEALYQSALWLCVSETSEGEELKPDSEHIWRRERECRQESRRLPRCLMCWVALRDHLELSVSQITAPHTIYILTLDSLTLSHTQHIQTVRLTSPNLTFLFTLTHKQTCIPMMMNDQSPDL